jgi:hypothetical protein
MVSFHKVREHFRKNTPDGVKEYTRGQGSRSVPYSGSFEGSMSSRPETAEKKPGFLESLKAKAQGKIEAAQKKIADEKARAKEAKEQEANIRAAVRSEEEEKAHEEATRARTRRIEEEERLRATEGSHYKLKHGLKSVFAATSSVLAQPKPRTTRRRASSSRSTAPRKTAPRKKKRRTEQKGFLTSSAFW